MSKLFKATFKAVSSMSAGLVLFMTIAIASAAGSINPSWNDAVYGSWWFAGLLVTLALNTGFCALRQVRFVFKPGLRPKALFLTHTSVVLVAGACLYASVSYQSVILDLTVGEHFPFAGAEYILVDAETERNPDGSVSDWISSIEGPEGRTEIRVNHPFERADYKLLQANFSIDYSVTLERGAIIDRFVLPQDQEAPFAPDGTIGFALSPPRDGLLAAAANDGTTPGTVDLQLTAGGTVLQSSAMFMGVPLEIGETGIRITVEEARPRVGLIMRHTPGLALVWAAFAAAGLSISLLALAPRHRANKKEKPTHE